MTLINKTELRDFFKNRSEISKEVINQHFLTSVENDDELLELFLILGADPNAGECKAMETMVERQNLEAIKLLHSYGGDPNVDLLKAIEFGNIELVEYMLENGAEVRIHYLTTAIKTKKTDMMRLIIKHMSSDISPDEMRTAGKTSVEAVNVLLEYSSDFPEETFDNGDSLWGYISSQNAEVLSFIIENIETKPTLFSKILSSSRCKLSEFFWYLNIALRYACMNADYPKIKVTVEYLEKKKELKKIPYEYWHDLCSKEKSIEKLNEILKYLKEHKLLEKEIITQLYGIATLETLEIFDIQKNTKCLQEAIKAPNAELIKDLLETVSPTEEEVKLAYNQVIYYANADWDKKNKEARRNIYEMLIKATANL